MSKGRNTQDRLRARSPLLKKEGEVIESDGQTATGLYVVAQGLVQISNQALHHGREVATEGCRRPAQPASSPFAQ